LGLLVAVSLIPFYLLTYNGIYRVDDEHILGARAQSLALWGQLDAPQVSGNSRVQSLELMGDQATQIEPLQSVIGAGLYRIGLATGGGGRQAQMALNMYLTALTAFVIYFTIVRLGFSLGTGMVSAYLFGLGSMAWPYATTFLRDTLAMLFGAVAFLGWTLLAHAPQRRNPLVGVGLVLMGVLAGLLAKSTMAVLPASMLVAAVALTLTRRNGRPGRRQLIWVGLSASLLLGVALLVVPSQGFLARYSLSYYSFLAGHFWESLVQGAWLDAAGPFVSPARSLFLFSPPLLMLGLLPWARRRVGWRVALPMAVFVFGLAVAQALFYRDQWAGTFGWGLRFMLPALPPLFVLLAPVVEGALTAAPSRLRWALGLCLAASAAVQLAGSLVPWRATFLAWVAQGLEPYTPQAAWQARFLVIPGQLAHLVRPNDWDVSWLRVVRDGNPWALLLPLACLVLLALAAVSWRSYRLGSHHFHLWLITVSFVALVTPLVMTQTVLRGDPALAGDVPAYRAWLHWANEHLTASDSVVVNGYASPLWTYMTNAWDLPVKWASLSYRDPAAGKLGPVEPGDWDILASAVARSQHLWLIASIDTPPGAQASQPDWSPLGPPKVLLPGQPSVGVWQLH
jgi:hypothetical protein